MYSSASGKSFPSCVVKGAAAPKARFGGTAFTNLSPMFTMVMLFIASTLFNAWIASVFESAVWVFKVMVTGGILNTRSYELVGPYTDIIMQKVVLDIAFIGVNGVDAEVGPTNTGEAEATVNALLASRASVSYVIADSSKVGRRAFATMDGYDFTRLITDSGISAADKAAFEARGTEVIVAGG